MTRFQTPSTSPPARPNLALAQPCGLLGSGGHAQVVAAALARCGTIAFVFDRGPPRIGAPFGQSHVLDQAVLLAQPDLDLHIAVGDNRTRQRIADDWPRRRWRTIVDPQAQSLADEIGSGVFVAAGAVIQVAAVLGDHAIVNTGAIVEHGCRVGAFVHVAPGVILCGDVRIGEGVLVGAGSVVLPGVRIGPWATVGAGAVVTRDVADGARVAGSPARVIGIDHSAAAAS